MFEKFLHQTPFFRLVLPFILGILIQNYFDDLSLPVFYFFLSFLLITILIKLAGFTSNYRINMFWGILVSVTIFFAGMQTVHLKQKAEYHFKNPKNIFIATITNQPEEKEKSIKTTLKIDEVNDSSSWFTNNSIILCYFQKDSISQNLKMGDQIIARASLNEIKYSGNPNAFNYKQYLKYKEIYYQTFIQSDQYQVFAHDKGSQILLASNHFRQKLLDIYQKNKIQGDEFAVLSALTLGFKNELTPELKQSFSTSGAMHVLAVSGLHVGIIFIILTKLLFFLQKNKYGKIIQYCIIICVLFFYAFLTGLSSSVLRATIMFTFISIGKMFTRQVNIYNTISASAFILLIYNPYFIMDVGFQLSYAAVLSIVFFQHKIYSLIQINYTIPDYLWQLISVAIAVQLGTFPITIHYFNQFPLYFILSNILIIPIATIIIYGAILLLCFSFSSYISTLISKTLFYTTSFLIGNVRFIENLPFSKLDSVLIDQYEVFILIILIFVISFFIISKRMQYLKISLWILIIFISYNIMDTYSKSKKSFFIVYNIPKISAIEFDNGNKNQVYTSKELNIYNKEVVYNMASFWKNLRIRKAQIESIPKSNHYFNFFCFKNRKIIQIEKDSFLNYKAKHKLEVDYIILSKNVKLKIEDLNKYFDFKEIIFDSSNSTYKLEAWDETCKKLKIPYHDILDQGAFIDSF